MSARRAAAGAVALAAVALAGCGGSPGDLMALRVSGGPAHLDQALVVTADGRISCNRGPERDMSNPDLLDARSIVREAKPLTTRAARYAPSRPGGRSFTLRDQDGSVAWDETSAGVPPVLPRAELFGLRLGPAACGGR